MSKKTLHEELLQKDSYDPSLEAIYREAKNRMFQRSLSTTQKIVWFATGLICLYFCVHFLNLGIEAPKEMPLTGRVLFLFASVFMAFWVCLSIFVLKKGTFHMIRSDSFINGLVLVFMVIMMVGFLFLSDGMEDKAQAILMILKGICFFLIFGVPALFNLRMNRIESNIREQLLALEIKLAEIGERMDESGLIE